MPETSPPPSYPFCVVGGGLVGLCSALELVSHLPDNGQKLALIAPSGNPPDRRTTAMLMPAINMLDRLGLWERLKPLTAPLRTMRLIDGSQRLVRAPVSDFHASEIDLEAFGYNVPNADMLDALEEAVENSPRIVRYSSPAEFDRRDENYVHLKLADGHKLSCQLVVAADGRQSKMREAAGISVRQWSYPQTAVVLNFTHSLPHGGVSAEFHTESGPFTQVPLPPKPNTPNRSSLVWLVEPENCEKILSLPLGELSALVEDKLQSSYGKCDVEAAPAAIPMGGLTAKLFGANRTVLVGEAGHVFPPIGAQGFNLGMRDLRDLISCLRQHGRDQHFDRGHAGLVQNYSNKRQLDVQTRTAGVDLMNRSLLTNFLPVQLARAAGLTALGSVSPLRKFAMWQGLGMEDQIPEKLFSAPGKDLLAKFRSRSDRAAPSR